MEKLSISVFRFLLFFIVCQSVYSQKCGGGTFIIEFYTKDNDTLNYEIKSAEIIDDSIENDTNFEFGVLINPQQLDKIRVRDLNQRQLSQFNHCSKDNGKIVDNRLYFNTLELAYQLYLLKVWNQHKEIYILANLLGGCNRKTLVVMSEPPILIKED